MNPSRFFGNPVCWKKSKKSDQSSKELFSPFSFADARKSFWMRQGLETATAGFPPKLKNLCTKKWYKQGELYSLTRKKKARQERLKSPLYLRLKKRSFLNRCWTFPGKKLNSCFRTSTSSLVKLNIVRI